MSPVINWTDVKPLEALDPGSYKATLTEVTLVTKASKPALKADYVKAGFTVSEDPYDGRKLSRNLSLSTDSLWAFRQAALTLGADPVKFEGEADPVEILQDLIGAECTLVVSQREYQGKMQNQIDRIADPVFA